MRTQLVINIEPCAGTDPAMVTRARWGVALYFDFYAGLNAGEVQPFNTEGSTTAQTWFDDNGGLSVSSFGPLRAACLITGPAHRVACVRINAVGSAETGATSPLSVTDPLVQRILTPSHHGHPACGACV